MGGCLKAIGAGVVLFLVFLVVVAVVGGGSRPGVTVIATAPAAGQKPGATVVPGVGAVVQGKNWVYQVTSVERPQNISDSDFIDGKPKGAWVAVFLTMTNIGKENFGVHAWDFELHDDSGVKYAVSSTLAASMYGRKRQLTELGGQSPPGVPLKSVLLFDVAPSAKGLRLLLAQERTYVALGQ